MYWNNLVPHSPANLLPIRNLPASTCQPFLRDFACWLLSSKQSADIPRRYLSENDMDFSYWAINGLKYATGWLGHPAFPNIQ